MYWITPQLQFVLESDWTILSATRNKPRRQSQGRNEKQNLEEAIQQQKIQSQS